MLPPQPPNQANDLKLDGLTREQMRKIEKSMKRPQFMGLLNEYMIEISDPKNKAEYDQYLKQMQSEGELPKHMKLVKLKPEFCFRTNIISNKNKTHEMKFFINMCSSEYMEKPNCEPTTDERGNVGYNWKVPNSLGKIRYDQDKHKSPCQVVDCAFHPDVFEFARHPSFQAMIIGIAIEGAQRQLGERKESLSRDYVVLKNLKCKGENGEPALLPIRYIEGRAYNRGEGPVEPERSLEGKQTKLQKEINQQRQQYESEKKRDEQAKPDQPQIQQEIEEPQGRKLIEDMQKGIQAPKFTSIYTYKTDYADFIEGAPNKKPRQLPDIFTVEFKVPRMENIAEASTLDINEKKIIFAVEGKYFIDISFEDMKVKNYPLRHAEAKAKFDKKKKTLRVQIPVDTSLVVVEEQAVETGLAGEGEGSNVVEEEVWKNKVLELPQQSQTTKFLNREQAFKQSEGQKEQKKLVQEIDQDDYIQPSAQDQAQGHLDDVEPPADSSSLQSHRFSVRDYLPARPPRPHSPSSPLLSLKPIFKQTPRFICLTLYMRDHHPEDLHSVLDPHTGQFILLWANRAGQAYVSHLRPRDTPRIERIEVLARVGYVSVVWHKHGPESLGSECWEDLTAGVAQGQMTLGRYEQLVREVGQRVAIHKQEEIKQKAEVDSSHRSEDSGNNETKQVMTEQPQFAQVDTTIQAQPRLAPPTTPAASNRNQQVQAQPVFAKVPVQFIKFNTPFIQVLD